MSNLVELNLRPDDKTLRQFGVIALVGFGFLATLAWYEWLIFAFGLGQWKLPVVAGFAAVGGLAALFSLVYPKANLPIYLGLSVAAYPIGFVLSYVILGTLFYVLIAPVGLFFKLTGRDPLARRRDPDAASYWVVARAQRPREAYFKQF